MDKIDVGLRLAELRGYTGLTRKSLSKIVNIPVVTIKAWEEGKTEIRPHNLEKYLKALSEIGCLATMQWVMFGKDPSLPPTYQAAKSARTYGTLGNITVGNIIRILSETSNLFYYLDADEQVQYINPNLQHLLGQPSSAECKPIEHIAFKQLCSETIYNICKRHFHICTQLGKQKFTYSIESPYNRIPHTVEMLYYRLEKGRSKKILGVLGFISNPKVIL